MTLAAVATSADAAPAPRPPAYAVTPGPFRADGMFRVTYQGSGSWQTAYRSSPPSDPANPGGPHDANRADDSSQQRWSLSFGGRVEIGPCGRRTCRRVVSLGTAEGGESALGHVAHTHRDGLFANLDQSLGCNVSWQSPRGARLHAGVRISHAPSGGTVAITALNPVADDLLLLPSACPGQTDSLDGLFDNYFTPGFSFAAGYGSDRWFTAQTVVVPVGIIQRARRISIRPANTRAGTPPGNCAVKDPPHESCTTGGSWAGVLTLTAQS